MPSNLRSATGFRQLVLMGLLTCAALAPAEAVRAEAVRSEEATLLSPGRIEELEEFEGKEDGSFAVSHREGSA